METTFILGFIIIGCLLIVLAISGSFVERTPLSTGVLYLLAGVALGPVGLQLIEVDPIERSMLLERATEVAVIVSLFTSGLKLRLSLRDPRWRLSLRLAFLSMAITVALVAVAGVLGLGLSLGAAVLLGAILAPTDPVLASDVQVREPGDRDRVRFALTSEAGLNDGAAFPFVMLGLGLLGLHEIGSSGLRWLTIDVAWAISAGIFTGAMLGSLVGHLVLYLRRRHREAVGLDEFLALGLVALAYGAALAVHGYGFLAVFAAGLAVRRVEARLSPDERALTTNALRGDEHTLATDPETAPSYMANAVLAFNEQIDRLGAMAVMLLVGAMLSTRYLHDDAVWFVPLLLVVIRPIAVWLGLLGSPVSRHQRRLVSWFGMRGIGSIYYLAFAIEHGVSASDAQQLAALTLSAIAVSVFVHGLSVTPLMVAYEARTRRTRGPAAARIHRASASRRRSPGGG